MYHHQYDLLIKLSFDLTFTSRVVHHPPIPKSTVPNLSLIHYLLWSLLKLLHSHKYIYIYIYTHTHIKRDWLMGNLWSFINLSF